MGDADPYSAKIVDLYLLMRSGYPFGRDELSPQDRRMLGLFDVAARRMDMTHAITQYLKSTGE